MACQVAWNTAIREHPATERDDRRPFADLQAASPIVALFALVLFVAGELIWRRGLPRHDDRLFNAGFAMSVVGGGTTLAVAIWWGALALVAAMPWLWRW
jgi:hypothetical protein